MKTIKKTGDACIRVLETLKFLYEGSASVQDIINHFEKIDSNNRIYTSEVVLKYINTLKVFGFRFEKDKDKYVLMSTPEQFDLCLDELSGLCLLEKFAKLLPGNKLKEEISQFVCELEKRFSNNTKILAHKAAKPDNISLKINYDKYKHEINEYEQYCQAGQRIKIVYQNKQGVETFVVAEPKEIKYIEDEVFFTVYNPSSAQIQDINLKSIIRTEQLPLRFNPVSMLATATFKISNNLAKSYKLKDGEKLLQLNPDGSMVILNQQEDRTLLLRRLMRYGENCEVLSPKQLREEMKQLIKATFKHYSS